MLQRAAAADAIVRTAWRNAVRTRRKHFDRPCAIAVQFRRYSLTGQRAGHENLAAVMLGDAVALAAEFGDVKCDGRHGGGEAGSSCAVIPILPLPTVIRAGKERS